MRAKDVMSSPVTTIQADATLLDAARLLVNTKVSAVPVVGESDAMAGIVSEVDLIRRVVGDTADPSQLHAHLGNPDSQQILAGKVADIMTRGVITANEDTALEDIASLMFRHQTKRIPILRERVLVGMVSRIDLVKAMVANGAATSAAPARRGAEDLRRDVAEAIQKLGFPLGGSFDVVVRHGVAHLWGQVSNESEDKACELAASKVPGIVDVMNHMQIVARTRYYA
jgi:CBS-domain-containing membrane protein